MTARIAHEIPDRPAARLSVGDAVQVGDRDTEWPEFVFVTAPHGTGWVLARQLSQPSGHAVVRSQLPTRVGEMLEVIAEDSMSGWLWGRCSSDRQGWVPGRTGEDA